jgi:hypothetical protein
MEAERHWHTTRMRALADGWSMEARIAIEHGGQNTHARALMFCADQIYMLIAERTK